jgi:hypothetical protein
MTLCHTDNILDQLSVLYIYDALWGFFYEEVVELAFKPTCSSVLSIVRLLIFE